MQLDFHYYATYSAAYLAGFTHEESLQIASSAQFTDCCTRTYLTMVKAPANACTTQTAAELAALRMSKQDRMYVTRIWASFHFLPADLYREVQKGPKFYKNKYRLICGPNGDLLLDTVNLAKSGSGEQAGIKSLEAVGIAMHILADTWAHSYFAGTPSLVINNTDFYFQEILDSPEGPVERPVRFGLGSDNLETGSYMNSLYNRNEHSVMNLGHGRAGHLPDYSFMHYKYLPAWGDYRTLDKNNPSDYLHAFAQMIAAMKYLRGATDKFEKEMYDFDAITPYRKEIEEILRTRQTDSSKDWKAFGESLSGTEIPDFDASIYAEEYTRVPKSQQNHTFLGRFILASLAQKSMITNKIYSSGNPLAGHSIIYTQHGFMGKRAYRKSLKTKPGEKGGPQE